MYHPVTDDIDSYFAHSESKRQVFGPSVEIGLPVHVAVEVDALHRRFGMRTIRSRLLGSFENR